MQDEIPVKSKKPAYRVEFHIIQVVYFDFEKVFTGSEYARLWSEMRVFGTERVVGAFWQTGGPVQRVTQSKFAFGSLEAMQPYLNQISDLPIYGGGTYSQKNCARGHILDCDFYLTLSDPSRWDGIDTRPDFDLALSGQRFETVGPDIVLARLKEHFATADRHAPPYGLIDLASPEDGCAGMVYGSFYMQQSPLHRWVEQRNWVEFGSRSGDRARGIYWGNYFGAKILDRLGGREEFLRRYRERALLRDGSISAIIWEFDNGVFVSLCLDPLGCRPGLPLPIHAMFNLEWLHREMVAKGVLFV